MKNQDIEQRLQNIIDTDLLVSKQLAIKTKRLYKKLNYNANATADILQELDEKNIQLMQTEKLLNEHCQMHAELIETEATLRHQIHRMRKKVANLKSQTNKSDTISVDDRFVYTKNALKQSLLLQCTKIRFHETRSPNRTTLIGYVNAVDKLIPFQEKLPADSTQSDVRSVLWEKVKLGSRHLQEWEELFTDDNSEQQTTL